MADVPVYSADETSLFGNSPLTSSLANAALGQDKSTTGTTTQNTNNTSTQNTGTTGTSSQDQLSQLTAAVTGSTTGSTAQNTAGTSTQNTTGTSTQQQTGVTGTTGNTSQTMNQSQNTSGTTGTTGTQRTTGNVTSTAVQNTGGTQTVTQNADTGALRDVLARQLGGITPEMLQAIFQEGSKAAPNLVVAQAGALGARGVGNSPMAQVLNQLNADLTSKAAALNVQLLSDASGTAGRIADLTKSSTTANQQTSTTTTDQVQDLLTATDQQQMTKQMTALVNSTLGSMNQTQTSSQATSGTQTQATTGTQNQAVTGTSQQNTLQNTAQTQNVSTDATQAQTQLQTGTQTQTSTLQKAEQEQRRQVLNTNLLGKAAGLLAGGMGVLAAFKAAGGAGYFGNLKTFVQGLLSQGTRADVIDRALRADNLPSIMSPEGSFDLSGLPDVSVDSLLGNMPDIGSIIGDVSIPEIDFSGIIGFADGGELKFLPTPNLNFQQTPIIADNGIQSLVSALGLGGIGGGDSGTSAPASSGGASAPAAAGSDDGSSPGTSGGTSGSGASSGGSAAPSTGANTSSPSTAAPTVGQIAAIAMAALNPTPMSVMSAVNAISQNSTMNAQIAEAHAQANQNNVAQTIADAVAAVSAADASAAANAAASAADAAANIGIDADSAAASAAASAADSAGDASTDGGVGAGGDASGDASTDGGVGSGVGDGSGAGGGGGGGGGGCFLTTAVTDATGGGDDDPLLETMRGFRDTVMRKDPQLSQLVDKYYEVAPAVVAAIDKRPDAKKIYATLREQYLQPGVSAVNRGDTKGALQHYSAMMEHVGQYANNKEGARMQAGAEQVLAAVTGRADGGHIQGPGTGISDSIPASGPNGEKIRVSNGEYIIPADVVGKFGADAFDKLVAQHHVPADMQRALFGE